MQRLQAMSLTFERLLGAKISHWILELLGAFYVG